MTQPTATGGAWGAVALCILGVALFSLMDVLMKGASLAMGAFAALFWRNMLATLFSGAALIAMGSARWPPAAVMRLHWVRAALIAPMAWLFFWGLTKLPMAETIALSFIAPIIALSLTPLLLGEKVSRHAIVAALIGVAGVAIIVGGRIGGQYQPGALLGALATLLSAVLFALNLLVQRRQAQVAGAIEVAFYQNLLVLALLMPFAPWLLRVSAAIQWPEVIGAALLTACSQAALSAAYAKASASRLIPLEYSAFLWAALFGWIFFAEMPTVPVLAGVGLIILACLVAARERPQLTAHVEAESA